MIILMVAVGYVLADRGWFTEDSTKLIARLVTQIALPPYTISSITNDFSKGKLLHMLPDLRYPVLSMLILYALSILIVRLIKVKPNHKGLFESMFFNSNTVFVVLPSSMPILMKQVFILQSCMPVMTNAPVVSKMYKADANFSSIMVTETTLLSLAIVPIMMLIISHLAL